MENNPAANSKSLKPRRISGFVFFAILFMVILVMTYSSSVETIYCDETTLKSKPDVIMLGAWWCPYCSQARKYLQYNEISYCEYDMERSAEGKRLYERANGKAIPILLIGEYQISGFSERSIEKALEILHSK